MDDVSQSQQHNHLLLCRRKLSRYNDDVSHYKFSNDLELLSINPPSCRYTSLKDILPSVAVNSPRPSPAQSESDICIRNRLVKQAAWSYLQPMSTPTCSHGGNIFMRFLPRLAAFVGYIRNGIVRVIRGLLRVIQVQRMSPRILYEPIHRVCFSLACSKRLQAIIKKVWLISTT